MKSHFSAVAISASRHHSESARSAIFLIGSGIQSIRGYMIPNKSNLRDSCEGIFFLCECTQL